MFKTIIVALFASEASAVSHHHHHHHHQVPAMGLHRQAPNMFAQSRLRLRSDPICSSAGCTQYEHPAPPKGHPMDYFVPNFGRDPDMEGTEDSIDIAQKMIGHKIIMGTEESKAKWHNVAKDTLYNYHPELDYDIRVSNTNEAAAEQALGTSMYP